jgi:hypothetical protein
VNKPDFYGYGGDGIFTHTALYSAPPPNTRLTYDGYGGDGIFTHTALYSAPPPNTRLTYDTVWFSFEGGKDTEVR